jgi:hypothetical protein
MKMAMRRMFSGFGDEPSSMLGREFIRLKVSMGNLSRIYFVIKGVLRILGNKRSLSSSKA